MTPEKKVSEGLKIRRSIKTALQSALPSKFPPFIVASMGRSGSTLIWTALCKAITDARFPTILQSYGKRIVSEQSWDLSQAKLCPGSVYKTHALAHELPECSSARVIFLFGPASDAALSVVASSRNKGPAWAKQHFQNLRANGPLEALGERDVLRFEEQLEGWIGKTGTPRIILNYEAIWENQEAINKFIGLRVALPERRPRASTNNVDAEMRRKFKETYAELDAKISMMPRCQILH